VAKGPVEVAGKDKVEAEWADLLLQDRVVIAYVQTAEQQLLMLQGSLVMHQAVRNVVQK
jgi:hypothetical protein